MMINTIQNGMQIANIFVEYIKGENHDNQWKEN